MQIHRLFTKEGQDPFATVEYELYDCILLHRVTGEPILSMLNCEVPKPWSRNARDTLIGKYFRRSGVPSATLPNFSADRKVPAWLMPYRALPGATTGGETSVKQVIHRIVGHLTYTGYVNGYFEASADQLLQPVASPCDSLGSIPAKYREQNARAYYDEMVYMMLHQMGAPNSPQWFNSGLWWAYGLTGKPQGHFHTMCPATTKNLKGPIMGTKAEADAWMLRHGVTKSENAYEHVQAHACYICGVEDSLLDEDGIMSWIEREARIFKFGSGSGANVSKLRGRNEMLSGGGRSSGAMSFIEASDRLAGAIKSGGTTRRAAKMIVLDIDHPDIQEFVGCKTEAEIAVASMVIGNALINRHCQEIVEVACKLKFFDTATLEDALAIEPIRKLAEAAQAAGVLDNYIQKAILLGMSGVNVWPKVTLDTDFEGRSYQIAPFQNANHSVRIPAAFFQCVKDGEDWALVHRTDSSNWMPIPARHLLRQIAEACWFSGDPGMQFSDTINDWNTTPADGQIEASNPCSEHLRLPNSACNLASQKLTAFLARERGGGKTKTWFDIDRFRHSTTLWTITLDITCTMAHLPSARTAASVYLYRDIGLGFCDLGALLMAMGIPYDSEQGRAVAGALTALMQGQSLLTSAELAKELGSYPRFHANREPHLRCILNHMAALKDGEDVFEKLTNKPMCIDHNILMGVLEEWNEWTIALQNIWERAYELGQMHGYRNAENTVIAPTGTIGLVLDCDTTGVEPLYGLQVFKQLVGGNSYDLTAQSVKAAFETLGYDRDEIVDFINFINTHGTIPTKENPAGSGRYVAPEHISVFATAASSSPHCPPIAWQGHIKMMAAVQPFVSGAISKTINMPA
ncbi:MAG: adenosylcobalamin-dependent ribonucleoside-diphosphate reductase, partial [Phycisphaerales bacterium]|nr:adenosylcobalamin-dependent ribonucleoside-diphosphate reductase [Phycisphaerales bacterium]